MSRTAGVATPKYRKHRATGQAITTISGRDHYLGPHGTKGSKVEYDRLIAEWLAAGRPTTITTTTDITVAELVEKFRLWAEVYYRKNGQPTSEVANLKYALKPVRELYGITPAAEFGPKRLKVVRQQFIRNDVSRKVVNRWISKIRLVFGWAVSEELLPPSVYQALARVRGLKKGKTTARETSKIKSVSDAAIKATLPWLPAVVADMVRLQRLTGCRPGEVCQLRPCDVDTDGEVWCYKPSSHKTEHLDHDRAIYIGPKAQDVLRPYLLRAHDAYCFTPLDSERKRRAAKNDARTTPLHRGNAPGTNCRRSPKRSAGQQYTKDSYCRAIRRAVDRANQSTIKEAKSQGIDASAVELIPHWAPNRLRHSAATKVREQFGLEAAQVVLGHAKANTTEIYAEANRSKAAAAMAAIG